MSLQKRGRVYYAIVRVEGKQRWIRVGTIYRDARRKHDELVAQAATGKLARATSMTLNDFADEWLRTYAAVRLKRSTYLEYSSYLNNHLRPHFGATQLSSITPQAVQAYVASKVEAGKLAPKSIRNHIVVLKRLLATACEWDLLDRNPAAKVALPRLPQKEMPFLTPDQLRQLIDSTPAGYSRLLIATACLTGARKGELLAMQHSNWSLEERTIAVRRTLYAGKLQEPKTPKSIRVLPMPEPVAEMYSELTAKGENQAAFVFKQPDGNPLPNGTPNRILRRALEKAGLPPVTFHALRHSFVAAAIAAEVPIKVIQELAGHASIEMTLGRYGHLLPSSKADAVQAISDLVLAGPDES